MNYDKLRKEEYDHGYKVGYVKGYTDGKNDRPHGEWVCVHPLQEDDGGAYMCSVCKTGDWNIRGNENFCSYCGADMRGNKRKITSNTPIYERPIDEWLKAVIDELESRKSYGVEYSQAMEDVIVILKARLDIEDEVEKEV